MAKGGTLPAERKVSDLMAIGQLTRTIPMEAVKQALVETASNDRREREFPNRIVVYYVILLSIFSELSQLEVLTTLMDGVKWLYGPTAELKILAKSAITQARQRLGITPLLCLFKKVVRPLAEDTLASAFYADRRLVAIDGTLFEAQDTPDNDAAFGRSSNNHSPSAYPQPRCVFLAECGTRAILDFEIGSFHEGEQTLARPVLGRLQPGYLCLADRNFPNLELWETAKQTGADLLWRVKSDVRLDCEKKLPDRSYFSTLYGPMRKEGTPVRVIEYEVKSTKGIERYRLITTLGPKEAPAQELAQLYHQRWACETVLGEVKATLKDPQIPLRSKTPALVKQEIVGLMLAHYSTRALMYEAARQANEDPLRLSFKHSVRVIRRRLPMAAVFPPGTDPCRDNVGNSSGSC